MRIEHTDTPEAERAVRALLALRQCPGNPGADVIGIVSAVEVYVDSVLRRLIGESRISSSKIGSALLDYARRDLDASWVTRKRWLKEGFDIVIGGSREQQRFDTVIDLRNALVHGDSAITDRQRTSPTKLIALKRALEDIPGVVVNGLQIVIDARAPTDCLARSIAFIRLIDEPVGALLSIAAR